MPRSLLAALVAALAAIAAVMPAAAWAQAAPTLTFDKPCYSPGDRMTFSGAGFMPGGAVELLFTTLAHLASATDTQADQAGAIADYVMTPDPDDVPRRRRVGAARAPPRDLTRAIGTTRADISSPRRVPPLPLGGQHRAEERRRAARAAKPMRVTAVGFTHAIGEPLYLHYTRAGRRLKTDHARPPARRLRRPHPRAPPRASARAEAGRYKLVFSTSAVNAGRTPSDLVQGSASASPPRSLRGLAQTPREVARRQLGQLPAP